MKKHLLLAALAMPMLFAACSSDDELLSPNMPNAPKAEGIKVNLGIVKDGDSNATRSKWNGGKIEFEVGDRVSCFWLGAEAPATKLYKYAYNSVYKNIDSKEGTGWESESMLFLGGNVIVFPADMNAYQTDQLIKINMPAEQKKGMINTKMPYISNYLDVQKTRPGQTHNTPGYNTSSLYVPVKPAANVLELTLHMKNYKDLISKYGFEIQNIQLVAGDDIFSTEANITTGSRITAYNEDGSVKTSTIPKDKAEWTYDRTTYSSITTVLDVVTSKDKVTNKLTSTDFSQTGDDVTVRFMILPSEAGIADFSSVEDASIIVNTNCGYVVLESSAIKTPTEAEKKADPTLKDPTGTITKDWDLAEKDQTKQTIAEALVAVTSYTPATSDASKYTGEKVGKAFYYGIDCDMNKAELNGSVVKKDEDIVRYLNLYDDLKKAAQNYQMNLIMDASGSTFAGLTSGTLDRVNTYGKVALASKDTNVELVSGGSVKNITNFVSSITTKIGEETGYSSITLTIDGDKNNWEMDASKGFNTAISQVIVGEGSTLTYKKGVVKYPLTNNGTIKIKEADGEITYVETSGVLVNNGTIIIANGQTVNFNNNANNIGGTIEVKKDGFLLAGASNNVVISANVLNSGTMASSVTGDAVGFENKGKIEVKDATAITYIQDNSDTNAEIILLNRDDEVAVNSGKVGKITYTWGTGTTKDGDEDDNNIDKISPDDKFTNIIFGSKWAELSIGNNLSGVSMVFEGTTQVKTGTAGKSVAKVTVNKNANLKVLTGNVLNVVDLVNNGTITVGGTINYTGAYDGKNGRVLTIGTGAIVSTPSTPPTDE